MKNNPQNTIFHLLLTAIGNCFNRQKKLTELWPFFQKHSENYNNGGTVREAPHRDFRLILNTKYFFWQLKVNGKLYSMDCFS